MTKLKFEKLKELVYNSKKNTLASKKNREKFALLISKKCELWKPSVVSFIEEMEGLSFYNLEDREAFIQFAEVGL